MKLRKIAMYRNMANLNQKDVADYLGMSTETYSKKERGVSEFKESEMIKFAKLITSYNLEASIKEIFF